ncbi:hypothetical protein E5S70_04885 [Ensifer adhaerens]|uniref:hypothetical protein n=1 Tax=Ensifer canadensis TaxID=555315 RepID=UPI00148FCA7A|nr:hypothetical protein [Ensifer canadensis]NOV15430.1 hypothetical protein [Ensifer canadensis]
MSERGEWMAQGKIIHAPYGLDRNMPADEKAPPVASPPRSPYGKYKSAKGPGRLKTKGQLTAERKARAIIKAKDKAIQAEIKKKENEELLKLVPKLDIKGRIIE